jgi:predicted Zn-dependent protease
VSARLDQVVAALRRHGGVDDFVAVERTGQRLEATRRGRVRRLTARHVDVALYRDLRGSRGGAYLRVGERDGDLGPLVEAAMARAARARGPAWTLPPPAAPARVDVSDPALIADPEGALAGVRAQLAFVGPQRELAHWRIAVDLWRLEVRTSLSLASAYSSTLVAVEGALAGSNEPFAARARRLGDLDWASAAAGASAQARLRERAMRLAPGAYDLVLSGDALAPDTSALLAPERDAPRAGAGLVARDPLAGDAAFGWFGPLLAQADARLVRQGLSRYAPGASIHGNAPLRGEPLTLTSDGTIPYGLRSRPFGDWGEPMRQLTLIKDGTAVDVVLDLREAALRGGMPSALGNIVLPPGRTLPDALRARAERPLVEAVSLAWLAVEPATGDFTAELDLGQRDDGTAVTGGSFRGNVFELLAGARYSARLTARAWYRGPEAVRVDHVLMT